MGLWGKSTSVESRPKFLKGDGAEAEKELKMLCYYRKALRAGTAAGGKR